MPGRAFDGSVWVTGGQALGLGGWSAQVAEQLDVARFGWWQGVS